MERYMTEEKKRKKKKQKRQLHLVLIADLVLLTAIIIVCSLLFIRRWQEQQSQPALTSIAIPSWIKPDLLVINPYSRPGRIRAEVNDIVIHYVANDGTSAKNNRDYFNGLAVPDTDPPTSASSHFVVGLKGEIIQCVPLAEVAFGNYPRNEDTISIEVCHPDASGKFSAVTEESLVKLVAWLCQELELTEGHVIRHYDVSGKQCPLYYVEHEDAWKQLKKEIRKKRKES